MHRGSSKDARPHRPASESLPLSALPAGSVRVVFVTERAAASTTRSMDVPSGTLVRAALRELGVAGEGCAVFDGGRPVPLDTPLVGPTTLTVVPTFSGG